MTNQPRPEGGSPESAVRSPESHSRHRTPDTGRRTSWRVAVFGIACAVAAAFGLRGAAQELTVFRARTELVRLDVRITDESGRPITDVRPEEVRVTENGVNRPVLLFRHLSDREILEPVENPLADTTTNTLPTPGHVYVLIFDQLHIRPGHEQRAMLAAQEFIDRQLKPGDAVAVYGLPGPGPIINLTTDFAKARMSLNGIRGSAARVARAGDAIADTTAARGLSNNLGLVTFDDGDVEGSREVSNVLRGDADQMIAQGDNEVDIFLLSLARVMRNMRWIEGRKNLILFSEGFSADHSRARLDQVAAAAAESYSVVYAMALNSAGMDLARATTPETGFSTAVQQREPLAALALETNGRLITGVDARTMRRAMTAIASEAEDYYLVGFEPGTAEKPSKYRRVNVTVKRRGVVVHARTGYSMPAETSPAQERRAIDAALFSPKIARGVAVEYSTYQRSGPDPARPRVILSVSAQVPPLKEGETVETVFVVRDAGTGQAVASGTDHVSAPAGTEQRSGGLIDLPYHVQFDVPPGEYWMRVIVRHPGGVMGSADRRFHVWPLAGPGITTSDLIITRLDGSRFDPPPHAVVHADDDVLAYLEIYGAPPAIAAANATVEILRGDSNQVVTTADYKLAFGEHGERIVRARLPVSRLTAGDYAARVRVVAPNQAARTLVRMFEVLPAATHLPTQE